MTASLNSINSLSPSLSHFNPHYMRAVAAKTLRWITLSAPASVPARNCLRSRARARINGVPYGAGAGAGAGACVGPPRRRRAPHTDTQLVYASLFFWAFVRVLFVSRPACRISAGEDIFDHKFGFSERDSRKTHSRAHTGRSRCASNRWAARSNGILFLVGFISSGCCVAGRVVGGGWGRVGPSATGLHLI